MQKQARAWPALQGSGPHARWLGQGHACTARLTAKSGSQAGAGQARNCRRSYEQQLASSKIASTPHPASSKLTCWLWQQRQGEARGGVGHRQGAALTPGHCSQGDVGREPFGGRTRTAAGRRELERPTGVTPRATPPEMHAAAKAAPTASSLAKQRHAVRAQLTQIYVDGVRLVGQLVEVVARCLVSCPVAARPSRQPRDLLLIAGIRRVLRSSRARSISESISPSLASTLAVSSALLACCPMPSRGWR